MNQIEWSDALSVGVKAIDDDHKHLVSIINKLVGALENSASEKILESVFSELEKYTVYHFDHEEQLMYAQCSSFEDEAYIDAHVKQHQRFFNDIPELKKKIFNASSKDLALEVVEYLANWLIEHIVTEDLSFTEYILKHKKVNNDETSLNFYERFVRKLNNKIPLSTRALLILLIPFLTLFLLSSLLSYDLYKKYSNRAEVVEVTKSYLCINNITDDLQKERGLSSGFISSNYTDFIKELTLQRELSSLSINECRVVLMKLYQYQDRDTNLLLDTFFKESQKLEEIREKVTYREMSKSYMMPYYTSLISNLLDLAERVGTLTKGHIDNQASLLLSLHLKEDSGLLRAEGVFLLAQKEKKLQKFKDLLASNRAYQKAFSILSTKEFIQIMQAIENSLNTQNLEGMEAEILGGNQKITTQAWFSKMSLKIELYKELISKIVTRINEDASRQRDKALNYMLILWISLFVVLLLAFAISFALKQSIVQPIQTFTKAMKRLQMGDKSFFNYTYQAEDPIKEMISAFENFRRSLIKSDLYNILLDIQGHKTDKFEKLSHVDPLTDTLNRRKFRELYETEFIKTQDTHGQMCVLALDLDKFKLINDKYGHDVGDKVLQFFTDTVQKIIRPTDYLARTGGEEFLVLLTSTKKEKAIEVAQRICTEIEAMDLSDIDKELKVTVSIGVGAYHIGSSMDSIMKESDKHLYKSKAEGRNRVSY